MKVSKKSLIYLKQEPFMEDMKKIRIKKNNRRENYFV